MPGSLSCRLFRSPKISTSTLRQKLHDYRRTTKDEGAPRPLVENVTEFRVSHGVARFTYQYDFVDTIPYRDETQKIVRTAAAEVAAVDPQGENLYYIYGRAKVADAIRLRIGRILAGNEDLIEDVIIPPERLRKLLAEDAVELKFGWWDGIDTYARKGALKGNVFKSKYYNDFKKGVPISVMFESKSNGRTIRISTSGSVTFYGRDLKPTELEQYVVDCILEG